MTLVDGSGKLLGESPADVEHGLSTLNWDSRWLGYRLLTVPQLCIHEAMVEALEIEPLQSILDAGCASGRLSVSLRSRFPESYIAGRDVNDDLCVVGEQTLKEQSLPPVDFRSGRLEALPDPDNAFDRAIAAYVLYCLKDPQLGLAELRRVVKPGGRVAVATIEPDNKPHHRAFERAMAQLTRATDPRVPAATFDSRIADLWLPDYFRVDLAEPVVSALVVDRSKLEVEGRTVSRLDIYMESLRSMRTARQEPYPSIAAWEAALEIVRAEIEGIIDTQGEFVDPVRHKYYVCTNTKEM